MQAHRVLTLLLLLLALVVAGCGGGDDDGGDSGGPALAAADDPASVLPAGAPVVVQLSTDIDSDQWQSALTVANRLEPSELDLKAELLKALADEDDGVSFESDIKPWLGGTGAIAIDGLDEEKDITGVLAVKTTDEEATKATLAKAEDGASQDANYKGVEYTIDDGGAASGIVDGFLVAASDEAHFKQAIDAAQGSSLADDSKYQDALALAPEESLVLAYVNVDPFLQLLQESGSIPPGSLNLSEIPGFQPGQTAIASLAAEEDKVTLQTASTAEVEGGDGPNVADLPGEAWLAAAGALKGEDFATGFEEGLSASGAPPEVQQALEQFGLVKFLGNLTEVSIRLGGETITSINGEIVLGGDDQDAASQVLKTAATFAQQAAAQQGVQIDVQGDTASVSAGPYKAELTAEDGDLKLSVGSQPDGSLGDDEAFKVAAEELGLDADAVAAYVDFASLQKLLENLPQDPDLAEGLKVISELGSFVVGTDDSDGTVARAVLTLR